METKYKAGDTVHLDYVGRFKDVDGKILRVVIRDKYYEHRDKYLVEVEYKLFGLFPRRKKRWFIGTLCLSKIT